MSLQRGWGLIATTVPHIRRCDLYGVAPLFDPSVLILRTVVPICSIRRADTVDRLSIEILNVDIVRRVATMMVEARTPRNS